MARLAYWQGLLVCLLLVTTACGFHPMYGGAGEQGEAGHIPPDIMLEPLGGREGQVLQNQLTDLINPTGQRYANPRYRLSMSLKKYETPVVVEIDGTIRRYNVEYQSNFHLFDTATSKEIYSGNLKRMSSYNVLDVAHYATFISQQDAAERGLKELAEDYRMRLGAYFAGKTQ